MGRVARYKKIKACDPFSASSKRNAAKARRSFAGAGAAGNEQHPDGGGGFGDAANTVGVWGLGENGRRVKKRSRTAQKMRVLRKKNPHGATTEFDMAPTELEDDFDMSDLVGSLKREKGHDDKNEPPQKPYMAQLVTTPVVATSKTATASTDATKSSSASSPAVADAPKKQRQHEDKEIEKEQAKLLQRVQKQVMTQLAEPKFDDQRPDEGKRAFNRRVKTETRQIIQKERQLEHNPLKRQRKKEFLNSKKQKKKPKHSIGGDNGSDDSENDVPRTGHVEKGLWTGERAVAERARATQVHFGEQAERPPVFHQLPRGAQPSKTNDKNKNNKSTRKNDNTATVMKEEDIEAERQAMELMRRKVQAQYAAIKARRKQAGDFHL